MGIVLSPEIAIRIAHTVVAKRSKSYVMAADYLARFILDHQWQLPGWKCLHCGIFNGAEKEWLQECRSCGEKFGSIPTIED
jgi:hypothetical protein